MDTEQLTSHTRAALPDLIALQQSFDGWVISVSKVHELLTKIHDILDSAVSMLVGDIAYIPAYLFHSGSRQCHLWVFRDTFHLVRLAFMVTLTGLWLRLSNNLYLACPSLQPLCEVAKPNQRLASHLMYKNGLCLSLVIPLQQKSLTWTTRTESCQGTGIPSDSASAKSTDSRKKGHQGHSIPDMQQSTTSSPSSSSTMQVGTLPKVLNQSTSIISNRFMFSMAKGYHL